MSDFDLNAYDEDDRFEATVRRIAELLNEVDTLGVTHIVSGDGNMEDDNLEFVENQFPVNGASPEERQLILLLKSVDVKVRETIWIFADYYK